jgi:putative redox protein
VTAAGLKDLYERKRRAILRRPSFAHAAGQARLRLRDGLCCEVEEDQWRTPIDQAVEGGGTGTAPHPAQVMRAAIVACLAMGYRQWGARLGVAIAEIEIDMLCETDVRGQLGIADVPIGWHRIMVDVCITSAAPEADVRRVVETADRLSPLLANLSPAIERVHRVRIIRPEEA